VSIRAYAAQQPFKSELYNRIDHYSRCARISWNLNRWVGFRIDILGAVFTTALAAYLVYGGTTNAANTGFSLNLATSFCVNIFWLIRIFNLLEVEANRYSIRLLTPNIQTHTETAAWSAFRHISTSTMILDRQNPVNPLRLGLLAETSGWKISTPVIHWCVVAFV
jgi:hypothetical protein